MISFWKKILCLGVALVLGLHTFSFAAWPVIDKDNPYTDATNAWGAEYIDVIWADGAEWAWQEDALINVIKGAINWTLGILGLIALIILLYGWFLMVIAAGNEEQYKKWYTILKQAAMGLALIGIAWFIVSIIFWLINLTAEWAGSADSQN